VNSGSKILVRTGFLLLLLMYLVVGRSAYEQLAPQGSNSSSANSLLVHPEVDSTPIVAVIVIGKDKQGNVAYVPNNVTIKVGEEILVLNNDTSFQSRTNGMSPAAPLAGRLFDTGPIPPRGL
jgi:hypothetical protein